MAGNMTARNCADMFANAAIQTSSNYCVDSSGNVAVSVDESNRSWCTSNGDNDHRAITIEVASVTNAEPFAVSEAGMSALIKLCADICKRNGIKKLLWLADKSIIGKIDKQNMTVHRWFAAKSCPGTFLYNNMGYIADQVNKSLGVPGSGNVKQASASPSAAPAKTPATASKSEFKVDVYDPVNNVRTGPGMNYPVSTQIHAKGIYTVTDEAKGADGYTWGKLKSGAGWIRLDLVRRI
jgi:hypothetical protein